MTTIDNNNYELWLLRYAEGELTAAEREAVEAWLADHPEAAEELALYSEAPRLERDESVRYVAMPSQQTKPLWPALLRWSAAAAVLAALMVPALRMGTMGTMEATEAPLVAEARPLPAETQPAPKNIKTIKKARVASDPGNPSVASISSNPSVPSTGDTLALEEPVFSVEIVETSSLIAYADTPEETTLIATSSLIVYDRSVDWGDALLAANDAFNENPLTHRFVSNLINRLK